MLSLCGLPMYSLIHFLCRKHIKSTLYYLAWTLHFLYSEMVAVQTIPFDLCCRCYVLRRRLSYPVRRLFSILQLFFFNLDILIFVSPRSSQLKQDQIEDKHQVEITRLLLRPPLQEGCLCGFLNSLVFSQCWDVIVLGLTLVHGLCSPILILLGLSVMPSYVIIFAN